MSVLQSRHLVTAMLHAGLSSIDTWLPVLEAATLLLARAQILAAFLFGPCA